MWEQGQEILPSDSKLNERQGRVDELRHLLVIFQGPSQKWPIILYDGCQNHSQGLWDKLYPEAATWLHAMLLNKRVWYLLRTDKEGELEGKNCNLGGEGDVTQWLTDRTSPLWSERAAEPDCPCRWPQRPCGIYCGHLSSRGSSPQRMVPRKFAAKVGKEVWEKRFPFLRLFWKFQEQSPGATKVQELGQ